MPRVLGIWHDDVRAGGRTKSMGSTGRANLHTAQDRSCRNDMGNWPSAQHEAPTAHQHPAREVKAAGTQKQDPQDNTHWGRRSRLIHSSIGNIISSSTHNFRLHTSRRTHTPGNSIAS